jgi:hypothetical protein
MGELQLLWSCTVGAPLAVRRARNRNPGGWVFWDSRVRRCATHPLRGYTTMCPVHPGSVTSAW